MKYRGEEYQDEVPPSTFVKLHKSIAVMPVIQNHSTRKEGIALSYRMEIRKAEAVCFHRRVSKVFRLCDSGVVRTPLPTQY